MVDLADPNVCNVKLDFKDLCFSVQTSKGKIEILKSISGTCKPGQLLAIMGPSGAGKTTLLDILADNMYSGTVSGAVTVNGRPRVKKDFRAISCYVMQRDILLSSATVYECLLTAALLKLPKEYPRKQKIEEVQRVMKELDLDSCAHTLIGDETIGLKGVSGGQKRRVSVGCELVQQPRLMFLDEPTSGLDSETAMMLMETLLQLARKDRTVVCTIHQPNSDITDRFDDVMLLSEGEMMFGGPWSTAVDWFTQQGYSCPRYKNPSDYFMMLSKDMKATESCTKAYRKYQQQLESSEAMGMMESGTMAASSSAALPPPTEEYKQITPGAPVASIFTQTQVLTGRFLRTWYRNPQMLASELVQYLFMALLLGLMYLNIGDNIPEGSFDRVASIWFGLAVMSFTPSYTAVVTWDKERLLLRKETAANLYRTTAFFWAKTLVTTPMELAQTTLFCVIAYFMVGYQVNAGKFFIYVLIMNMFQLTSESIGLLVAVVARTATTAVVLLTLILLLLLSFSGFLMSSIPVYFRWLQKLSYLTYAFNGAIQNEFSGLTLYDNGVPVDGFTDIPVQLNNLSLAGNIGVLAAQMVGTRLLTWIMTVLATHFRYL